MSTYQVMPRLSAEEYDALKADIVMNGVLVPVVKDQHGNVIDGHHRIEIANEIGVTYRVDTVNVSDEDEARDLAFRYNVARRHLTREQKRQLVAAEIAARPDDSDRAIGRRLGVDHKTVGSVRRALSGEIPHPAEPPAGDPTEADIAKMLVEAIERRYRDSEDGPDKDAWAMAMQLTDEIIEWGTSKVPTLFWFTIVAQYMYRLQRHPDVWSLMATWMVPVAKVALEECQVRHEHLGNTADLPGEKLARITVAIWDGDADPELRWVMFEAMESRIAEGLAEASALFASAGGGS